MKQTRRTAAPPPPPNGRERLRLALTDMWQEFSDSLDQYQWPYERSRWKELVFCILYHLGQDALEAAEARQLVEVLDGLDLLDVERLAAQVGPDCEPDATDPDFLLTLRLLDKKGLSKGQAARAATTISQVAHSLHHRYKGKVQRYLRAYGQRMLDELQAEFPTPGLKEGDKRHIFAHWLQNTANLPVELMEPAVTRLCKENKLSAAEWIELVDDLDFNLAVMDDIVAASSVEP
jgi:hypothetical protein